MSRRLGPPPWYTNGAWWTLIGAVALGVLLTVTALQLWQDLGR